MILYVMQTWPTGVYIGMAYSLKGAKEFIDARLKGFDRPQVEWKHEEFLLGDGAMGYFGEDAVFSVCPSMPIDDVDHHEFLHP